MIIFPLVKRRLNRHPGPKPVMDSERLLTSSTELKYVTAAVYTNFTTTVVDDTGIEQEDGYTTGPRGNQLTLKFTRA